MSRSATHSTPEGPRPAPKRTSLRALHRFAERHRRLLNLLLHAHPALLEGPLGPLLRAPRLVDFDNKRAFFRARARAATGARYAGSLRIHVRREHVFEDSFHQLRAKCGPPKP